MRWCSDMELTGWRVLHVCVATVGGGRVDVFRVGYDSDLRSGFAQRGERRVTIAAQYFSGVFYQVCRSASRLPEPPASTHMLASISFFQVSALRWQALDDALGSAPTLLSACTGSASPEHAGLQGSSTGIVMLLRNDRRQVSTHSCSEA